MALRAKRTRREWYKHALIPAALLLAMAGGMVPKPVAAAACPVTTPNGNCSNSETESIIVTAGSLDLAVPVSVSYPTTGVGQVSTATPVGGLTWTDTLGGVTPTITVQTTDLCQSEVGAPTCTTSNDIPASDITMSLSGASISAQDDNGCVAANNAGGAWSNGSTATSAWSIASDTTPGTTLSSPFTVATASTGTYGCYGYQAVASPTVTVSVPSGVAAEPYTGTLTYTITD